MCFSKGAPRCHQKGNRNVLGYTISLKTLTSPGVSQGAPKSVTNKSVSGKTLVIKTYRMCPSNVPRLGCSEMTLKEFIPKHRHPEGAQCDPWCSHTLPAPFEHRNPRMPRRNFKSVWKSRRPSYAEASSCNPSTPKHVAESFASHIHVQPYVSNL